jgi:hypothetical protein
MGQTTDIEKILGGEAGVKKNYRALDYRKTVTLEVQETCHEQHRQMWLS